MHVKGYIFKVFIPSRDMVMFVCSVWFTSEDTYRCHLPLAAQGVRYDDAFVLHDRSLVAVEARVPYLVDSAW